MTATRPDSMFVRRFPRSACRAIRRALRPRVFPGVKRCNWVKLVNGKVKEFVFDVTDQLAGQPRGGAIHVSGLRIEDDESSSDSGFDVDLDGWGNDEEIDLPVGGQQ